jgi:uncharacterized protein YcbX
MVRRFRQIFRSLGVADAIEVTGIYRYPVKGLSPQPLPQVRLEQGEPLPFDRAWAIENGPSRFDPSAPRYLPKIAFLMLMRDERLAALKTEFDEASHTLTVLRGGKPVARGDLETRTGRAVIEQFIAAYMKDSLRGPPRILSAPGHTFSDVAARVVHIINLASLAEVERAMGRKLNPLRFRPNIIIAGAPPWQEFGWIGKELRLGSRGLRLMATNRVVRCPATNVDPETGARDADVPALLDRQWGHTDFGIYARVSERGVLCVGDNLTPPH